MVPRNVLVLSDVGIQPTISGTVGSLCFNESKARDFEKFHGCCIDVECMSRKAQQGKSVQGLVRTCLEMCAVDLTEVYSSALFNERSVQLCLSTGVAADMGGQNLETKSRPDKCSNER